MGNYLPLTGGTLTGNLTGTSGTFNLLTMGGEAVATTSADNPAIRQTALNLTLGQYPTNSVLTATVEGYLPLTGGVLTGNLVCPQLTCYAEVDTGSLTCTSLSVNGQSILGN